MHLVTTETMRRLEQAAVDAGATWAGLMEEAGAGVARVALATLAEPVGRRVVVLVGPGNNGGDGLVAARHLHDAGIIVTLYLWRRSFSEQDRNWRACRERAITELAAAEDADQQKLHATLADADLAIDALLGMGVSRPVEGELATLVAALNESACPVLAIDLPTGVDSDTGIIRGAAVHADLTVATGLPKRGLLLYPGRGYAGRIAFALIGLAPGALEDIMDRVLTVEEARALLPPRPADAHKGTFGKVLIVAGSLYYPGAAGLASAGAGRVGAGLVTLATPRSIAGLTGRGMETTLLPLPEGEPGVIGEAAAAEVRKQVAGYQALLVGPGLAQEEPTVAFLRRLLGLEGKVARSPVGFVRDAAVASPEPEQEALPPIVIDADGLNLLAKSEGWQERLPGGRCVLTPHPGEMRRLLGVETLPDDRVRAAAEAATTWGQVVVLKGATTVIAAPDGSSAVYDGSNPALATAGTGDVLAGAITGLLAQGLAPYDAARLGVYLHGAAGALVRDEIGVMGALAGDLLPRLPRAIRLLQER